MSRFERKCIVCGKISEYCPYCAEYAHLPTWRAIYCSENCKELFDVSSDYLIGKLSDEETRQRIQECDLSYKENVHCKIAGVIEKFEQKDVLIEKPVKIQGKKKKKSKQNNR